ncbi:MAG: TAXI family TRAP transporter solute-binding subunit [Rhodospirillales bacterium]
MSRRALGLLALAGALAIPLGLGLTLAGPLAAADRPLVVGTAPVSGSFYPAGGAVCREINRAADDRLACLVAPTEGSEENLKRLLAGDLDLAVVQSDWAYHAAGRGVGGDPPFAGLRSLFSLQPLVMTLVAGPQSGIGHVDQLGGKTVSIGPAGSGLAAGARLVLEGLGFAPGRLELVEMPVDRQISALCNGEIDAFLIPVAHPNGAVSAAVDLCAATFVPVGGERVARLLQAFPYYGTATIPAGLYLYNADAIESVGLVANVVVDQGMDADLAYQIVKTVFGNLDDLRAQHPVLENLNEIEMTGPGLPAPLHEGALRFYREQGWR